MKLIFISLLVISVIITRMECASPNVYYANVGDTVTLRCTSGGGNYACFSTYAFQNKAFRMAYLNNSRKYQISPGSIGLTNIQATDAGFYACSNDCNQMKVDQVSYYLQPTLNGQPTDLGKQFLAIPPFDRIDEFNKEAMYVVVLNETPFDRDHGLSTGEIVGLVIGCVVLFLVTVFLVLLFIFLSRRKKKKNQEKILESKNKEETSVEYSTIDRSETGEKKSLSDNKVINSKNMTGPNIYSGDLSQTNVKELPNVDLNSTSSHSQHSQQQPLQSSSKQGSYNASYQQNPSSRSYQNQLDSNAVPRPNRRESDHGGILAPPPAPSKMPVNNIHYPRNGSGSQPPQSNENLHQIIKESGFGNRIMLSETPLTDEVFGRPLDSYTFDGSQEPLQNLNLPNRQNSTGGIDLESNGDGGVTVVSARTPLRSDSSQGNIMPPIINRLPPTRQQLPPKQPLSFSQRIETTSTPLQLQPSSASVRAQYNGAKLASNLKDGATDV